MGVEIVDNTFYQDFEIANRFGRAAVLDTYSRCVAEWRTDARYMAALVIALNQQCWHLYEVYQQSPSTQSYDLGELFSDLYHKAYGTFLDDAEAGKFSEEGVRYFFEATD